MRSWDCLKCSFDLFDVAYCTAASATVALEATGITGDALFPVESHACWAGAPLVVVATDEGGEAVTSGESVVPDLVLRAY